MHNKSMRKYGFYGILCIEELHRLICNGSDGMFLPAETVSARLVVNYSVHSNPLSLIMMTMMTTVYLGFRYIVAV